MKAFCLSRGLILAIALVVSLGANVTLFVGGVVFSFVDEFVEQFFDTPSLKQRRALAALKKENASLRKANGKLERRLLKVRRVAKSRAKRSGTRLFRSATRNVATLPGQALPFIGTAIAVGVTALEIEDLCDTMRDMDAIRKATGAAEAEAESELSVCSVRVPSAEQVVDRITASGREAWDESKEYVPDLPGWDDIPNAWRNAVTDIMRNTWDGLKRLVP